MKKAEYVSTVSGSVHGHVLQAHMVTADTIVLHAPEHRVPVPWQLRRPRASGSTAQMNGSGWTVCSPRRARPVWW